MSTRKKTRSAQPAPPSDDDVLSLDALAGDDEAPPTAAPSDDHIAGRDEAGEPWSDDAATPVAEGVEESTARDGAGADADADAEPTRGAEDAAVSEEDPAVAEEDPFEDPEVIAAREAELDRAELEEAARRFGVAPQDEAPPETNVDDGLPTDDDTRAALDEARAPDDAHGPSDEGSDAETGEAAEAEGEPGVDGQRVVKVKRQKKEAKPAEDAPPPLDDIGRAHLRGLLEALLFVRHEPTTALALAKQANAEKKVVVEVLEELRELYKPRGINLEEVASGWIFRTAAAYAPFVREATGVKPVRLTRAQIETLAICAYRQPVTRPEIDDVRGVDSGPVLKLLLERDLVKIIGKRDEPGRPLIYGTTPHFLEFFGLKSLRDMPTLREFTELSDDSKRAYERELGEDAPQGQIDMGGLSGGEGHLSPVEAAPPPTARELEEDGPVAELPDDAPADDAPADDAPADLSAPDEAESPEIAQSDEDDDDDEDDEDDDDEDDDDEDDDDEDDDDDDDDDDDEEKSEEKDEEKKE